MVLKLHIYVHRHQVAHALTSAFCLHDVFFFFVSLPHHCASVCVCVCMTAARLIDPSIASERNAKKERKKKKSVKTIDVVCVCVHQFFLFAIFYSIRKIALETVWTISNVPVALIVSHLKGIIGILFYVTQRQASREITFGVLCSYRVSAIVQIVRNGRGDEASKRGRPQTNNDRIETAERICGRR